MWGSIRALLALQVAAVASTAAVLTLALGLPMGARHGLTPAVLLAVVLAAAGLSAALGTLLLWRAVARPVDQMLAAARRLGRAGGMPALGEQERAGLSRAAVLFGRVADELLEERRLLAAKVGELTRAGRELGDARAQVDRAERLATVGRLAAGLAHEIGNPLGAVCGYVEVARGRLPQDAHPDLREAVARIADASARIDRILRALLDFARPGPALIGEVQVGAVVEGAVRLAQVQPRFRAVQAVVAVPPDLPPVRGEEGRLVQVLLNLLLNAGDAMGGDGRVEVLARADGPDVVEIAVADRGPGILPQHLPRLFEPFFSTKEPGEGTGLGLATSQRMVEEMDGTLSAANGPSGGAVFRVRLRRAGAGGPAGP